jgi:hypothetical protein
VRSVLIFLCFAAIVASVSVGCSKKADSPAITKFAIGKNAKSEPPANSYAVGDVIYATAKVSTPPGKYNINFVVTVENVENRTKDDQIMNKSVDFEGEQPLFLHYSLAYPGDYTVTAILSDKNGNQLDSKSEKFAVTGEGPTFDRDHDRKKEAEKERENEDKDSDRK